MVSIIYLTMQLPEQALDPDEEKELLLEANQLVVEQDRLGESHARMLSTTTEFRDIIPRYLA